MSRKILLLFIIISLLSTPVYSATVSRLSSAKKSGAIFSVYDDRNNTLYRTDYLDKAYTALKRGNSIESCILCQNLIDSLIKKVEGESLDSWLSKNGRVYQDAVNLQRKSKRVFDSSIVPNIRKAYANRLSERSATLSQIPEIYKVVELPSKGSLGPDMKYFVKLSPRKSLLDAGKNLISFYLVPSNRLFFEELPVPNDSINPQISRWGRSYSISTVKWAPDGLKYAYLLNGALCINSLENSRPLLISEIPDNLSYSDLSFSWAADSHSIAYVRNMSGKYKIYVRKLTLSGETYLGQGNDVLLSQDGRRALLINGSAFRVVDSSSAKLLYKNRGKNPFFSVDGKLLYFSDVSGKNSLLAHNFENGKISKLFQFSARLKITGASSLCKNLYAVTTSDSMLHIISDTGAHKQFKNIKAPVSPNDFNTPNCIISGASLLLLK